MSEYVSYCFPLHSFFFLLCSNIFLTSLLDTFIMYFSSSYLVLPLPSSSHSYFSTFLPLKQFYTPSLPFPVLPPSSLLIFSVSFTSPSPSYTFSITVHPSPYPLPHPSLPPSASLPLPHPLSPSLILSHSSLSPPHPPLPPSLSHRHPSLTLSPPADL